jgi:hypothetical protein
LLARSAAQSAGGALERYKIGDDYDATTQHPEWMGT